jgi:hypothetical protein
MHPIARADALRASADSRAGSALLRLGAFRTVVRAPSDRR